MNAYRSTSLKLWAQCPLALQHFIDGTPQDRDLFATGIAAHAILQAVGEATRQANSEISVDRLNRIVQETTQRLMQQPRLFDGQPEPPLPPEAAIAGRTLALGWLMYNGLSPTARYETGLGIRADGSACAYDDNDCRYKAAIDVIDSTVISDEETESEAVIVGEYKTAWSTDASELDTLQCRGQAVIAAAHYPDATAVISRVYNLRTGQTFERTLYPGSPDDADMLDQWRRDIMMACNAADKNRIARPGIQCGSCSYFHHCADALQYEPTAIVDRYLAAVGQAAALSPVVRQLADQQPIETESGAVGWMRTESRSPRADAYRDIAIIWHSGSGPEWSQNNGATLGLLASLQITTAQVERVAKSLYPGKDNREVRNEFIADLTETVAGKKFVTTPKKRENT
jgi:hypothetical protein